MVTFYRRLPEFDYLKPSTLDEALDYLAQGGKGKIMVYAGGTDVIPKLKGRLVDIPAKLLDLKGISGLDYIRYDDGTGLRIGALASIFAVGNSSLVQEKYPILAQAARSIAATQVQNRGTVVGNICNAIPSADAVSALLCLNAKIICVRKGGERTVELNKFFVGPGLTDLASNEIVTEVQVPPMIAGGHGTYIKFGPRSRMDCALVGVAAVAATENGIFKDARIGLGSVAPTPIRAVRAEKLLVGKPVTEEVISGAARAASDESRPIDDHRASAEYRRMLVEALVGRAIRQVI
ncbi:MAG: xanthine dehydrogenase family protein subunit M [Desulfobacterales bacterium]|nr:xanthine dehydrogenase family protein subunit M [Desulfobacterales bacterium]